jgi:adenylate cyclase
VRFLDRLYTDLDALVDRHGLEKVKTSGDSYMVVSGVPEPREDHIEALASLALDMADAVADLKDPQGRAVPLRIGLAAGPVVARDGDYFGPVVNLASRLTELAAPGEVLAPAGVRDELQPAADDAVRWVSRGIQQVRSIGPVEVFSLERSG